jgi:hypothetical protein
MSGARFVWRVWFPVCLLATAAAVAWGDAWQICAADDARRAELTAPEDRDTPGAAEKPQEVERWPL